MERTLKKSYCFAPTQGGAKMGYWLIFVESIFEKLKIINSA